ncbi:MAG: imidazole glycerol phosphate synthase subunit HisH [bacterium]
MSNVIGVVNYGIAGNIHSIKKALEQAGADYAIVESADQLTRVDKIILPGVGSFKDAISELHSGGLFGPLKRYIPQKPTLGICLGMQILSNIGFEFGTTEGMGLFNAEVKPILCDASVPHMGFNKIKVVNDNHLLTGIDEQYFYFMHSYEVVNYTDIAALTTYSEHQFVSAIAKGNVFGVQFHPEKSRGAGIQLFKNFINL